MTNERKLELACLAAVNKDRPDMAFSVDVEDDVVTLAGGVIRSFNETLLREAKYLSEMADTLMSIRVRKMDAFDHCNLVTFLDAFLVGRLDDSAALKGLNIARVFAGKVLDPENEEEREFYASVMRYENGKRGECR